MKAETAGAKNQAIYPGRADEPDVVILPYAFSIDVSV